MICGSRMANRNMLHYTQRLVESLALADPQPVLLVGDAKGVDQMVVQTATRLNMVCFCAGISPRPRNGGATNKRSTYLDLSQIKKDDWLFQVPCTTYTLRDEWLARRAHVVYCVWDGRSPGTQHVYEYAKSLYKDAKLICP